MVLTTGDFVRLDFSGSADGVVFDTTLATVARAAELHTEGLELEPIVVCVGSGQVLPGLDAALLGKEAEGSFSVTLRPEEAFGKKRADLLKLMPLKVFRQQQVRPVPGLEVTIDGMRGTIRSVSGNRIIVDFNHPLAGKEVTYEVFTRGLVTAVDEQVVAVVARLLRFAPQVRIDGDEAVITLPVALPEAMRVQVQEAVVQHTPVTHVSFAVTAQQS